MGIRIRLTESQCVRIARALAEPRRVRILQEIGTSPIPLAQATLLKVLQITPPTLSHHVKELETAGLIKIVRAGKFARAILQPHVLRAYLSHLVHAIEPSIDPKGDSPEQEHQLVRSRKSYCAPKHRRSSDDGKLRRFR